MKKSICVLLALLSFSAFADDDSFERGYKAGLQASQQKGRVVVANGYRGNEWVQHAQTRWKLRNEMCAEGDLKQVICIQNAMSDRDYHETCAGLCVTRD